MTVKKTVWKQRHSQIVTYKTSLRTNNNVTCHTYHHSHLSSASSTYYIKSKENLMLVKNPSCAHTLVYLTYLSYLVIYPRSSLDSKTNGSVHKFVPLFRVRSLYPQWVPHVNSKWWDLRIFLVKRTVYTHILFIFLLVWYTSITY